MNYKEFVFFFMDQMDKPYLYQKATSYFPEKSFLLLRIVAVVMTVFIVFILYRTWQRRNSLLQKTENWLTLFYQKAQAYIKETIPQKGISRLLFILVLLFYFIRSVFCIFFYPIDFDEADTYNLFSSQGPLVSASFYPLPNNHILFSVITSFTSWVIPVPELALRLPLLLIGLLLVFFVFALMKRLFSEAAAFVSTGFFIASFPVFLFSYLARGYLLLLLFYILAFYFFYRIVISKKEEKIYYVLFTVACVFGLYTIPTFLYALAGFVMFWIIQLFIERNKYGWVSLFKTFLIVGVISSVLYIPVFITARWELLQADMNPTYTKDHTLASFQLVFSKMAVSFLSPSPLIAVITGFFLIAGLLFAFQRLKGHQKSLLVFCTVQLLFPFLVFFVFRQAFPPKPWMHLSVVITILIAAIVFVLTDRFPKLKPVFMWLLLLLLAGGSVISFTYNATRRTVGYNDVAASCEPLIKAGQVKTVYADIPYFKTMVSFYAYKHNRNVSVFSSRKKSNRFEDFDPLKKYDLIVTDTGGNISRRLQYAYDTVLLKHHIIVLSIRK
ncbi:MAG: glycosyltransferase family 39 protein [Lacibacter sp.]